MTSIRHTNGDYLSIATLPTMSGDWTIHCWMKCNTGEYGGAGEHIVWGLGIGGGSSEGLLIDIGITNNTTVTAVCFRNGGGELQTNDFRTGSFTGWVATAWRHTSGSNSYDFSWRLENSTSWTTVTLTLTTPLVSAGGSIYIGSDQFTENAVDSDTRHFFCQNVRMSDATLLTASQNINSAPAGTNLHWLILNTVGTAGTNGGTAGNWTVTGTLQSDATEPSETLPGSGINVNWFYA